MNVSEIVTNGCHDIGGLGDVQKVRSGFHGRDGSWVLPNQRGQLSFDTGAEIQRVYSFVVLSEIAFTVGCCLDDLAIARSFEGRWPSVEALIFCQVQPARRYVDFTRRVPPQFLGQRSSSLTDTYRRGPKCTQIRSSRTGGFVDGLKVSTFSKNGSRTLHIESLRGPCDRSPFPPAGRSCFRC